VATVCISLVRAQTEKVNPPRALWVPFALGRPLGSADDPEFQPDGDIEWTVEQPLLTRHLADDLRTYYHEAIAAQPGPGAPNHDALNAWIFGGTVLGETFQAIADHLTEVGTPLSLLVRGLLIPEGHYQGGSAFPKTAEFGAAE